MRLGRAIVFVLLFTALAGATVPAPREAVAAPPPAAAVGQGFGEILACAACIAGGVILASAGGTALAGLFAFTAPPAPSAAAPPVAAAASSVTGQGIWSTIGCIACVTGFLIAGGTTVVGVAAVLAANPEIAVACVATCASVL